MATRRSSFFVGVALAAIAVILVVPSPRVRADTVYLKDGSFIGDCQVVQKGDTHVTLRTPTGDMVVPLDRVSKILEQKTAYDTYEEELANLREDDVVGTVRLAEWCRRTPGLRKESNELVARALALDETNARARALAGHFRVGKDWIVPEPLTLRLEISGEGKDPSGLRAQLELFLASRIDVRLADRDEATASPLDSCRLTASVTVSQSSGATLYGRRIGGPSLAASVAIGAASEWLRKKTVRTSVDGQVPVTGGAAADSSAIQNALATNGEELHRFLDKLQAARAKALAKDFTAKKRADARRAKDEPRES